MLQRLAELAIAAVGVAAEAEASPPPAGFWDQFGDKIVVSVVTAILVLALSEPIKLALKKLTEALEERLAGPGWRFRQRYLRALKAEHRWLKLIGFLSKGDLNPPRLQEVYVSLRVTAGSGAEGARFGWHEALGGPEGNVVLLGAPGAGKSTLLDYLVLVLTGEVFHPVRSQLGKPFPLFARLRELGESAEKATLLGLLRQSSPVRAPSRFPERWLARGGCAVLLDGLDEVLDEARHARAVEEIRRLAAEYPGNRYLVTCRVAGWQNQLPGFRAFEISPLEADDVRQYAGAWYREVLRSQAVNRLGAKPKAEDVEAAERRATAEASARATALFAALQANANLLLLARTPLMLSLITLVHYHRVTDLPKGRAALYGKCLEILLDLWDRQDKTLKVAGPSLKEKLLVLQAIAFDFLQGDRLEAGLDHLEEVVEPLLGQLREPISVATFVAQIWQRSGVLVEQKLGRYGFAHRALHDFLAASYVVEHQLDRQLIERVAEERWREVILIAAGLAPAERARQLVAALLGSEATSTAALEMAGLSLAEDIQVGEDLRERIRCRLLARLREETRGPELGRLYGALIVGDLPAATRFVAEVLGGRDGALRSRVMQLVLPDLGKEQGQIFVPLLLRLTGEASEGAPVRAQAARALGKLGAELDTAGWAVLAAARADHELALRAAATCAWCELGRFAELGLVEVPAGEVVMGSPEGEGAADERPQHTLFLPRFFIGRYPVTVAELRAFAEEASCRLADAKALAGPPDHPATWVTWRDALAYAQWHGLTLPSEAEWERAARGSDGRKYPWGDVWQPSLANAAKARGTTPVGRFSPAGDSPFGCADMAGNVWEWTRSLHRPYPYDPTDGRESPSGEGERVLRGGSCFSNPWSFRCACRWGFPNYRYFNVGFRVMLSPFSSDL